MGRIINEVGNHYGRLTVIEYMGIIKHRATWKCKCDCGNECVVNSKNLRNGATKSCGCQKQDSIERNRRNYIDIKGMRFGRLTAIEKLDERYYEGSSKTPRIQWRCKCDCGEEVIVTGKSLRSGNTKSCGCLNRDINAERLSQQRKGYNNYELHKDYVTMYTLNNEPFYVDLEDFDYVKDICWYIGVDDYLYGKYQDSCLRLHSYIMSRYEYVDGKNYIVDHIGGNKTRNDNRKSNLRVVTFKQNAMNRKKRTDNTSGITGVSWSDTEHKWVAYIGNKHLGRFDDKNEAIQARHQAEEKYFGEYSYNNSQLIAMKNKKKYESGGGSDE